MPLKGSFAALKTQCGRLRCGQKVALDLMSKTHGQLSKYHEVLDDGITAAVLQMRMTNPFVALKDGMKSRGCCRS